MAERKLVGTNEMFKKALAGGYAIGAYNVNNMEILQGIAEAAEETQSPIILQVSAGARKYSKDLINLEDFRELTNREIREILYSSYN